MHLLFFLLVIFNRVFFWLIFCQDLALRIRFLRELHKNRYLRLLSMKKVATIVQFSALHSKWGGWVVQSRFCLCYEWVLILRAGPSTARFVPPHCLRFVRSTGNRTRQTSGQVQLFFHTPLNCTQNHPAKIIQNSGECLGNWVRRKSTFFHRKINPSSSVYGDFSPRRWWRVEMNILGASALWGQNAGGGG